MQVSNISQALLVREYPSFRAFSKDASELYARTGYTVMNTNGMPQRGGWHAVFFLWPHEEHLVITYQAPSHPRPGASPTP
ncbi:MAG: hypothetical protein ACXVDA_18115 [Ktedonobacterales bacterium]